MNKKMRVIATISAVLVLLQANGAFAKKKDAEEMTKAETEEIVVVEEIEEVEEIKEGKKEKEEQKIEKGDKEKEKTEDAEEEHRDEKSEDIDEKGKPEETKKEVVDKIKKFTKEEFEQRKEELKSKKIEAKEYFREIKEGFGDCDAETKKEILGEIAKIKSEIKDYSIGVFARGKEVDFDKYDGVKPRIENGRALVPIRAVTESLGATVEWIEDTQTIRITKGDIEILLEIENTVIKVNGEDKETEVAPKIEKGRTLVPLRVVSEALKERVDWDEESQTIIIEDQDTPEE